MAGVALGGLAQALMGRLPLKAAQRGFHTRAYHGTMAPSLEGDVLRGDLSSHTTFDRMLGPHVALDPRVTDAFTVGEYAKNTNPPWVSTGDPRYLWAEDRYGARNMINEGGNVIPVALRGQYKKVKGDSQWGELRDQILEGIGSDEDVFSRWFSNIRQVPLEEASRVYRAFGRGDPVVLGNGDRLMDLGTLERLAKPDYAIAPHRFRAKDDPFKTELAGYDTPGQIMANYDAYGYGLAPKERRDLVQRYRDRLRREGFSGVQYENQSTNELGPGYDPTTFIVSDPDAIRSLFARFERDGAGLGRKAGGLALATRRV